jgi:hypothetical protein
VHGIVRTLPCTLPYTAIHSGSMREASCGSMIPPINYLFIYLFSVYSGSMRQASCKTCQYYLFIIYYLFIYLVPAAAACVRYPAHDGGQYDFIYYFAHSLFII